MPTPSQLEQLESELKRSMLISEEDRLFWLQELPTLPTASVENLLKILKPKNQQVDEYLDAGLQSDQTQSYLMAIKAEVIKTKKQARQAEEKSQSTTEEQSSEDLMQQLDQI